MQRSFALLLSLWSCAAFAQLSRLEDLNTSPARPFPPTVNQSFVMAPANDGGISVFAGGSPGYGVELWRTDGTAAGTFMVKDLSPSIASSNPREFVVWNGAWYFLASDGVSTSLYRTDGTPAGTVAVVPGLVSPARLTPFSDRLVFLAGSPLAVHSYSVGPGKQQISSGNDAGIVEFAVYQNKVVYTRRLADAGLQLAAYDVGNGVTTSLSDFSGYYPITPNSLFSSSLGIFLSGGTAVSNGLEPLWTDGTVTGGRLVQNINPTVGSRPSQFSEFLGKVYFAADEGADSGVELWCSDGTSATRVSDINDGSLGTLPNQLTRLTPAGSLLYFRATTSDAGSNNRLYRYDGGAVSRVMDAEVSTMAAAGTGLVFGAVTDAGLEPWVDSTGGATALGDLYPGPLSSLAMDWPMSSSNGRVWFGAQQPESNGFELWAYSGGTATRVANTGPASSNPAGLTRLGNAFFFTATDGGSRLPWLTDGTPGGTRAIAFPPGASALREGALPRPIVASGRLYFSGLDSDGGHTLWSYEPAGAALAVVGSGGPFRISEFAVSGGNLFYVLQESPTALYVAPLDGGATALLGGPAGVSSLAPFNDGVLFAGTTTAAGNEPWFSDGTQAGTQLVRDFIPGAGNIFLSSYPTGWVVSGRLAFYNCMLAFYGRALCVTDGTFDNTAWLLASGDGVGQISMVPAYGGVLFGQSGRLWYSNGDPDGGTWVVPGSYESPKLLVPFKSGFAFAGMVTLGGLGGPKAAAVFQTDGVSTSVISTFNNAASEVTHLESNGEMLVMRVATGAGNELWVSDGTAELTAQVGDVWPGPLGSAPAYGAELAANGTLVLANAMDQDQDVEPWVFRFDRTPPVITASTIGTQVDGGWFVSDVSVNFAVTDPESPTVNTSCSPTLVNMDSTVQLTCTSRSWGGTSTATVTVQRDASPPTIACDRDIVAVEAQGDAGTTVVFAPGQVVATDEADPAPQITLNPPSGTLFPIGETIVTATATDQVGFSKSCEFTVSVADRTAPTLVCPANYALPATSLGGATAQFTVTEVNDLVDPKPEVVFNPGSGSTLQIGTHPVTVIAWDESGNTSICKFTVTVTPYSGDSDGGAGGGGGGGSTGKPGCGCNSSPSALTLALGMLLAVRRRRPRGARPGPG